LGILPREKKNEKKGGRLRREVAGNKMWTGSMVYGQISASPKPTYQNSRVNGKTILGGI